MEIIIENIEGLIPFTIYLCDNNFNSCNLLQSDYKYTSFSFVYSGTEIEVGVKIITQDGQEIKKLIPVPSNTFIDCPLDFIVESTNPNPGINDGTASVQISNCFGAPSIIWSNGQTQLISTGMTAGTYSVSVTDTSKLNCTKTKSLSLYEDFYFDVERCDTIKFSELKSSSNYFINWGDGFESYEFSTTTPSKVYSNLYTGTITLRSFDLTNFESIVDDYCVGKCFFRTKELNKLSGLTKFETNTTNVEGKINELPKSLKVLKIKGEIDGYTYDLPSGLTKLVTSNYVKLSGGCESLPSTLTHLEISKNYISGNTSNLPSQLTSLTISDYTTIEGNTFTLPRNLKNMVIKGFNTISGNTYGLPPYLEYFELWGSNTISGPLSGIPKNIKSFIISGKNTISGNISNLPTSLNHTLYLGGNNNVGGDLIDLPPSLKYVFMDGTGTTGTEIVTGNIDNLNPNVETFVILGNNQIHGELLDSSSHDNLLLLNVEGDNTISGNTANLPQNIQNLKLLGMNTMNSFSAVTKSYWTPIDQIYLIPTSSMSEDNVSRFLQNLVTLNAKPGVPGLIKIKGVLNLENNVTNDNYQNLITKGFDIQISTTF